MDYDEGELREVGQLCDSGGLERMGEQLRSQGDGYHSAPATSCCEITLSQAAKFSSFLEKKLEIGFWNLMIKENTMWVLFTYICQIWLTKHRFVPSDLYNDL